MPSSSPPTSGSPPPSCRSPAGGASGSPSEWIAVCLTAGLVMAPRATRLVATIFTTLTISDALQFAYAKLEETAA